MVFVKISLVSMISRHNSIYYMYTIKSETERNSSGCITGWLWWWQWWWRWGWCDEEAGVLIPCLSPWGLSHPASPPSVSPFLSPAHSISFLLLVSVWWIQKERTVYFIISFCCCFMKLGWCNVTAMYAGLHLKGSKIKMYLHMYFLQLSSISDRGSFLLHKDPVNVMYVNILAFF